MKEKDLTVAIITVPYHLPQPGVPNTPGHDGGAGQDGEFTQPHGAACWLRVHIEV